MTINFIIISNITDKGINETDFINTMFLRSSFFKNWSETNYFINPTLKTSKNLLFNDKWYLDFLQDSYSTGVVYDKPNEIFLNYYRQWHSLKNRYMVEKFYDVKKENFLNDLTDFIYAFAVKYKMFDVSKKIVENVDRYKENRYPRVKLKQDNWKLIDKNNINNQFSIYDEKWYIIIAKNTTNQSIEIIKFKNNQNEKSTSPIINNLLTIHFIFILYIIIDILLLIYIVEMVMVNQKHLQLTKILVKLLTEIVINKLA
ncbi:spiroplasma plectrovirus-related protein [Spiroplasma phoeniceum P40]|uniref:Spiroplasma plectrovirus-related protein n=1 Tax=Spiroplasma phoeniceum P40 TaxID=1276259 RepID=A0A345DPZ2_9MOLU|nr:DUF3688 family protein [Spiroplasma phoeniceum]AXF96280.1 spiroplasma plectrovirus-related protein [Spiroplasma phoeniceum P40]